MIRSDSRSAMGRPERSLTCAAEPAVGITVYGCAPDEAVLFRELAPRFGVTPTLTDAAVAADTVALAHGNQCISVGHKSPVTRSDLRALRGIGVTYISTRSVGFDHIDLESARTLGMIVENVAYSPDSVADFTLMLMLMAVRQTRSIVRNVDIQDYRLATQRGRELRDLTVGVVGTGRIGTAVIERLRGFGCRIVAHDTRPSVAVDYLPLTELLRHSDIVTLHTPLNSDTRHLLDPTRLGHLKRRAFVINTGRGPLVDTEALVSAVESGRLGGAALDVVEGEEGIFYADCRGRPLASDLLLRLQALPNVIITPHTAYYTDHALSDTVANSLTNCLTYTRRGHHVHG